MNTHTFSLTVQWEPPADQSLSRRDPAWRQHVVTHPDKPAIHASAAPPFHGDGSLWNPEDLLLAALSQCHMLTFFYLAHREGLTLTDYTDTPTATLETYPDGSGNIIDVLLTPRVSGPAADPKLIDALHKEAHGLCFIARSVNFPVRHEPTFVTIT